MMYPNLYLLNVFLTVIEEGSFKKAADKLLLTPSAVSSYMRTLEKTLNKSLFEKKKGEILLTKSGMQLLEYALRFRQLQTEFSSTFEDNEQNEELIKIGGGLVSGSYLIPQILSEYQLKDKHLRFSLTVSDSMDIIKGVSENLFDLGFVTGGDFPPDVQSRTICQERYVLVSTKSFLNNYPQPITKDKLRELPFVLSGFSQSRTHRRQLAYINHDLKLNIRPVIEVSTPEAAKEIIKTGRYVGFLLYSTVQYELSQNQLVEISIPGINLTTEYSVIWKGALNERAKGLLQFIIENERNIGHFHINN